MCKHVNRICSSVHNCIMYTSTSHRGENLFSDCRLQRSKHSDNSAVITARHAGAGIVFIPKTIAVHGVRKSRLKMHSKQHIGFFPPPPTRKDNNSCPSISITYKLQQLPNLTCRNIIHCYETCPQVEFFFQGKVLERMCLLKTRIQARRLFEVEFQVC